MSMAKKSKPLPVLILLVSCISLAYSVANASEVESEKIVIANENARRDQQQAIEAIRDENRRLRAVIEEMQRVLNRLTDTGQAVETPEVEVETEVDDDDLATKSELTESPLCPGF